MNWFKRHLHWTIVIVFLGAGLASFVGQMAVVAFDPWVSDEALYAAGLPIALVVLSLGWGWVLRQKRRSLWWLPLALFVPLGWVALFALEDMSQASELSILSDTLSVTDKGRAAVSYQNNSSSIGVNGLRILKTVARNPGMSVDEVIYESRADVLDIDALVNTGLLRRG
jgi:hypothetical protein